MWSTRLSKSPSTYRGSGLLCEVELARRRRPKPGGVGGRSPPKIFKFGFSEMPSPAFSAGYFQLIKTKENAVISCLFYPSLVLSVRYRLFTAKKGKRVTPTRTLQEKRKMYTGKLCYNVINIDYILVLVYMQNCKRAQSLVCHAPS